MWKYFSTIVKIFSHNCGKYTLSAKKDAACAKEWRHTATLTSNYKVSVLRIENSQPQYC